MKDKIGTLSIPNNNTEMLAKSLNRDIRPKRKPIFTLNFTVVVFLIICIIVCYSIKLLSFDAAFISMTILFHKALRFR